MSSALTDLWKARNRAENLPANQRDRALELTLDAVREIQVQPMQENTLDGYKALERQIAASLAPGTPSPSSPGFFRGEDTSTWTGLVWAVHGLFVAMCLVIAIEIGVLDGRRFGDAQVSSQGTVGDLVVGFLVIPLALGLVAGIFSPSARPPAGEIAIVTGGMIVLFGIAVASEIDLNACPEGCDAGATGIVTLFLVTVPLAGGFLGGMLARRAASTAFTRADKRTSKAD